MKNGKFGKLIHRSRWTGRMMVMKQGKESVVTTNDYKRAQGKTGDQQLVDTSITLAFFIWLYPSLVKCMHKYYYFAQCFSSRLHKHRSLVLLITGALLTLFLSECLPRRVFFRICIDYICSFSEEASSSVLKNSCCKKRQWPSMSLRSKTVDSVQTVAFLVC